MADQPQRPRCHFCKRRRLWQWVSVPSRMNTPGGYTITVPMDLCGIGVRACRQCAKAREVRPPIRWERKGRTLMLSVSGW